MRTDRQTDRPTDRQTDIATYRAAIAAKNEDFITEKRTVIQYSTVIKRDNNSEDNSENINASYLQWHNQNSLVNLMLMF